MPPKTSGLRILLAGDSEGWAMSIKAKLIFAFATVAALLATQLVITINLVGRLSSTTTTLATDVTQRVELVANLSTSLVELRGAEFSLVLARDPQEMTSTLDTIKSVETEIGSALDFYAEAVDTPEKKALYDHFLENFETFQLVHDQLVYDMTLGRQQEAQGILEGSRWLFDLM